MRPTIGPAHGRVHIGAKGTNSGGDKFERRLDFGAVGIARPEFRRVNHRVQDSMNIAVAGFEGLRHARDESGRRIVGDETAGKLRGNELGGAGTTDEKLDHLFTIFYATSMNLFSKNDFRIRIVDAFVKFELRIFARLLNGPASEQRATSVTSFCV